MKTLNIKNLLALTLAFWLPLAGHAAEINDTDVPAPRAVSEALTKDAAQSLEAAKAAFAQQQRQALSLPSEQIVLPVSSSDLGLQTAPRIAQTTRPILIETSVQATL